MGNFKQKAGPIIAGVSKAEPKSKNKQSWRPQSNHHEEMKPAPVKCPYCSGPVDAGSAICPHCGHSLTPGRCSFCGAPMRETARFCTKCGQSREGVVCQACGTLNSRNFCRNCNRPLTPMAQKALAEAKSDPKFKAIQAKAQELAELHAKIEGLRRGEAEKPEQLSESDIALLDEYADLLTSIGAKPQNLKLESNPAVQQRKQYDAEVFSLEEIMNAYKEKAAEMDAALAALTPPEEYTPEQQRDYYSARKVARIVEAFDMSGYDPMMWQCNLCGALHKVPSECVSPELGGTWIYISPEEYKRNMGYDGSTYRLEIE